MSYFPNDIPYMTDEELEEHGINAKRERNEMSYISEKIDKIHANTIEIKSVMGNTIMMLDNIKSALKADVQSEIDAAYQRGLDDVWDAARKMLCMSTEKVEECFGVDESIIWLFHHMNAAEAIEKLKAYEKKQKADDKIKVRDEVIWTQDENVAIVVTRIYTANNMEWCDGVCQDGKVYHILTENARKTGRRFDIDKILEEMKK